MNVRITIEVGISVSEIQHRGMKGHLSTQGMEKAALSIVGREILDALRPLKGQEISDGVVEGKITSIDIVA